MELLKVAQEIVENIALESDKLEFAEIGMRKGQRIIELLAEVDILVLELELINNLLNLEGEDENGE